MIGISRPMRLPSVVAPGSINDARHQRDERHARDRRGARHLGARGLGALVVIAGSGVAAAGGWSARKEEV